MKETNVVNHSTKQVTLRERIIKTGIKDDEKFKLINPAAINLSIYTD